MTAGTRGLCPIAVVYSPSQAALVISALEGAGFDVFAPGYHLFANAQHMSFALGGLSILVPISQADHAFALLAANEAQSRAAPSDALTGPTLLRRIVHFLIYWFTGTCPTLHATFLLPQQQQPPIQRKRSAP